MNKKISIIIILITILIVFVYLKQTQLVQPANDVNQTSVQNTETMTDNENTNQGKESDNSLLYSNDNYGFSFNYSNNYVIEQKSNYLLWLNNKETIEYNNNWYKENPNKPGPGNYDFISIKVHEDVNDFLTLREWFDTIKEDEPEIIEDYYIGDIRTLRVAYLSISGTIDKIYIPITFNNSINIIEIETQQANLDENNNYFTQFLSTLKLLN